REGPLQPGLPALNPAAAQVDTHGLQRVDIYATSNPDRIQFHDNLEFAGVRGVRVADHTDMPAPPPGQQVSIERGAQTPIATVPGGPVAAGAPPNLGTPGRLNTQGSVIPGNFANPPLRVPEVPFQPIGQQSSPLAGQPENLQLRTHAQNPALHDPNYQNYDPNAQSANNPTTQLNTRRSDQYLEPGDQNRPPGWIQIGDPN